jgi:hypothetical protein
VGFDVAREMRAFAGNEKQIAVGNCAVEKAGFVGLFAFVMHFLGGFGLRGCGSGSWDDSGGGSGLEKFASVHCCSLI